MLELTVCWRCKRDVDAAAQKCDFCHTASPAGFCDVPVIQELSDISFVIATGPTGGGKTVLGEYLKRHLPSAKLLVKHTDRAPRNKIVGGRAESEVDGRDYHFEDTEWFDRAATAGLIANWTRYGNRYALAVTELLGHSKRILVPLIVTNVETALGLKRAYPQSRTCYVCSTDLEAVRRRAEKREMNPAKRATRMRLVEEEIKARDSFDYLYEYEEDWGPVGHRYHVTEALGSLAPNAAFAVDARPTALV